MGSIVAMYLRIDANNMDNFKTGLYYKLFTFVISMAFIPLLPTNQEVMELKQKVNPLDDVSKDSISDCDIQNLWQDFEDDM